MKNRTKPSKGKRILSRGNTPNPLRIDPTRTATLRRVFGAEIKRRFARLKGAVYNLIAVDDALGRRSKRNLSPYMTFNKAWTAFNDPQKVEAFQQWIRTQIDGTITGLSERDLWRKYIEQGYTKGAARSYDDVRQSQKIHQPLAFYQGTKDEFLRSSFADPVSVERVQLLVGRSFTDLEGITNDMETRMTRVLTDGLIRGHSPRQIGRTLGKEVDLGSARAQTIARTEIIRAHAEGQLQALEDLDVESVGVAVEWSTAKDDRVCDLCSPLEGEVMSIADARGMLPMHPNCFVSKLTRITTIRGRRAIGKIEVGDKVLTHKGRYRSVLQVHKTPVETPSIEVVKFAAHAGNPGLGYSGMITVTDSHPILKPDGNWISAKELNLGDEVVLQTIRTNFSPARVHYIRHQTRNRRNALYLYNLSVEEDESFVADNIVVHNCRCAWIPALPEEEEIAANRRFLAHALPDTDTLQAFNEGISNLESKVLGLINVPDVRQVEDYDCGAAVVKSVVDYLGINNPHQPLKQYALELMSTRKDGTQTEAIARWFTDQGIQVILSPKSNLEDLTIYTTRGYAIITPIQDVDSTSKGNRNGHYVIVRGLVGDTIYLQDPINGRISLSASDFDRRWHDVGADGIVDDHLAIVIPHRKGT